MRKQFLSLIIMSKTSFYLFLHTVSDFKGLRPFY